MNHCKCKAWGNYFELHNYNINYMDSLPKVDESGWFVLRKCPKCGTLWRHCPHSSMDRRPDVAVRILEKEGWEEFDPTEFRIQALINKYGELDEKCNWSGCANKRLNNGVIYCAEHQVKNNCV